MQQKRELGDEMIAKTLISDYSGNVPKSPIQYMHDFCSR